MKKLILLITATLLLTSYQSKATHAAGGYLTYQYLHDNVYSVTVTFYRDCSGIAAPASMEVDFVSSLYAQGFIIPMVSGGTEIGFACSGATTCSGGKSPGYSKYVYQGNIDLGTMFDTDWAISFQAALSTGQVLGRNSNITTLIATCADPSTGLPAQCNLYTATTLDNVNHPTNSSVTFINDPVVFICNGQVAKFNLGATDPNADSLSYQFVGASGNNDDGTFFPLTYHSPLSGTNPLFPGAGAATINHTTGDVTINTSTNQFGVIDINVIEYKSGVQVGSVQIEAQVIVQTCAANNYPTLSGINNTSQFADTVCPGSTVSFTISSNDIDAGQIVTMVWDNGIPNANFTSAGTPHPTGTFSWKTSAANARPQPYTFTVTVTDNNCPVNGFQTLAYSVYVIGPAVSISPKSPTVCSGQSVTLTASGATSYVWSTQQTTTSISVSAAQTYTVTGTTNGCSATATQSVTLLPAPTVSITPTSPAPICEGGSVQLCAVTQATGYVWTVDGRAFNGTNGQCINAMDLGDYIVTVTAANGCSASSSPVHVAVTSSISVTASTTDPTTGCTGAKVKINASGATNYHWSPNGETTSSITVTATGSYFVVGDNGSGCSGTSNTIDVKINKSPTVSITPDGGSICEGGSMQLCASVEAAPNISSTSPITGGHRAIILHPFFITTTAATNYSWTVNGGPFNGTNGQCINAMDQGDYIVTYTDDNGCTAVSSPAHVTVSAPPTVTISTNDQTTGCTGLKVTLTAQGATKYNWSPNGETSSAITVTSSGTYFVVGNNGDVNCSGTSNSIPVLINNPPTVTISASSDTVFCRGDSVTLTAAGADTYLWQPGLQTTSSIVVKETGTYFVVGTNATTECTATSNLIGVKVNENPTVTIIPQGNTSLCEGGSVQLCASNGSTFAWTVDGRAFDGTSGMCISAQDIGSYVVTITDNNGCSGTSAPVSVTVSLPPTVVVTPNGTIEFCIGGSVTLTAATADHYLWSDKETGASITVTSSGSFYATGFSAQGCPSNSNTVTVIVNPLPTVSVTPVGPLTFCDGQSVTLTASGAATYVWSPNSEQSSSIAATKNGSYSAVGTDGNGCTGTSNIVQVTVEPNVTVTIAPVQTGLCLNSTPVTLSGSPAGGTFSGPGVTGNTFDPSKAGIGTFTITYTYSASGVCIANPTVSTQVTVGEQPVVTISLSPTIACANNTIFVGYGPQDVTLTANTSVPVVSFQWYLNGSPIPDATSQTYTTSVAGSYSVLAIVAGGCTSNLGNTTPAVINVIDVRCGHNMKKVVLCHVPPGNPGNPQTLCIAPEAVPAHLRNHPGDCLGPCDNSKHGGGRIANMPENENVIFNAYPNPFSSTINIEFEKADQTSHVLVEVFSLTGEKITVLFDKNAEAGVSYHVTFDGSNLPDGVYVYRITDGEKITNGKLILIK